MGRLISISSLIFALTSSHALADQCGDILKYGVWEYHDVNESSVNDKAFANWACRNASGNDQTHLNTLSEYGQFQGDQQRSTNSSDCSADNGSYHLSQTTRDHWNTASRVIVGAWAGCMSSHNGSHASLKMREEANSFSIILNRYTDADSIHTTAAISTFPAGEIRCNKPMQNLPIKTNQTDTIVICTVANPQRPVEISVAFGRGQEANLYIPSIPPTTRLQALEVGKWYVITSTQTGYNLNVYGGNFGTVQNPLCVTPNGPSHRWQLQKVREPDVYNIFDENLHNIAGRMSGGHYVENDGIVVSEPSSDQAWQIVAAAGNKYKIKTPGSDFFVGIGAHSEAGGTHNALKLTEDDPETWTFAPAP